MWVQQNDSAILVTHLLNDSRAKLRFFHGAEMIHTVKSYTNFMMFYCVIRKYIIFL